VKACVQGGMSFSQLTRLGFVCLTRGCLDGGGSFHLSCAGSGFFGCILSFVIGMRTLAFEFGKGY
jgi:hypothetical protein